MNLILLKEKKHFREKWLILLGIWGDAELILGIWRAKAKYFRGVEDFFQGFGEIICITFREQGSTDPLGPH